MNESVSLINNIIKPLIEQIDGALDTINTISQFTADERHQLTAQLGTCAITLSAFEHKLRTQGELSEIEMLDLQRCAHDIGELMANFEYFNRQLKEYWDNMNPGTQQQTEATTS